MQNSEQQIQPQNTLNYQNPQQLFNRLNHIHSILTTNPPPHKPLTHLKQYVTLYIQNRSFSDQAFLQLCEHQIVSLFFGFKDQNKNVNNKLCLQTLQIFNLLLANTTKPQELGYLLSQNSLHQGLFINALTVRNHEFIEYYSQVLKSITMKLSQKQNRSLIRVFYNTKYPGFPLMLSCTFMATDMKQQLVRVTARQCVLVLIILLKQKGMTAYLSQLPMLLFYARLVQEQSLKIQLDEGDVGYLGDLMWGIKQNLVALFTLANLISNSIFLYNIKSPVVIIKTIRQIVKILKSHCQEVQNQIDKKEFTKLISKIQTAFYSILERFLFRRYMKSQFLAAYFRTLAGQRKSQLFPENISASFIIKKLNESCAKTFQELEKETYYKGSHIYENDCSYLSSQLITYCERIQSKFNADQDFIKQKQCFTRGDKKQLKRKQNFNLINSVMRKVSEDYIYNNLLQSVSQMIGFKVQHGVHIRNQLMHKCIQYPNATIFVTEFCHFSVINQRDRLYMLKQQTAEISLNELRNIWSLDKAFLNQILAMIIEQKQHSQIKIKHQKECQNSKIEPVILEYAQRQQEYISGINLFICKLSLFLSQNISSKIDGTGTNSIVALTMLQKVCKLIKVNLNDSALHQLIKKVETLHSQIQGYLFQNGFSQVTAYLLYFDVQKVNTKQQLPIFFRKLIEHDILQRIAKQNKIQHISLQDLFQSVSQVQSEEKEEEYLYRVSVYGKNNCELKIYLEKKNPAINVQVSLYGKKLFAINLLALQSKVRVNQVQPNIIHCGENSQPIQFCTTQQSQNFLQVAKKFRFAIDQTGTMAILRYLQISAQDLKKLQKQSSRKQISQKSRIFRSLITPH